MKRISVIMISFIMLVCLFGCGASNKGSEFDTNKSVGTTKAVETAKAIETTKKEGTTKSEESTKVKESSTTAKKKVKEEFTTSVHKENTTKVKDKITTTKAPTKPQKPVDPGSVEVDKEKEKTCYLSIDCKTILDNMGELKPEKEPLVPADGVILPKTKVKFYEGESVFDLLQRETRNRKIHMDSSFTPAYNSAYIRGINNLYEFDCGSASGWMYCVNGWFPNYGVSRYQVKQGDVIEFRYTCAYGSDIGDVDWMSIK